MAVTVKKLGIAAIGDELYIRSVRLLGLSKFLVIDLSSDVDELRKLIKEFLRTLPSEGIGLVIMQDTLKDLINDISSFGEAFKVVYLPDLRTSEKFNVKDYYLQLLKYYIGISLEV
ncbi:MAG: hypothetical protein QXO98_02345 [Sulfolobales archaeon]